jgi:multimeric flavodoxin WrbA
MVNECIEKTAGADGIILGSPTYFADLTPELKALIDQAGFVGLALEEDQGVKVGGRVNEYRLPRPSANRLTVFFIRAKSFLANQDIKE